MTELQKELMAAHDELRVKIERRLFPEPLIAAPNGLPREPLRYEVCRWLEDDCEPVYQEVTACGKRGQVIASYDTLEQAQRYHFNLETVCGTKDKPKHQYFINTRY